MKTLGIWIMVLAVLIAGAGAAIYTSPSPTSGADASLAKSKRMLLDSCLSMQGLDKYTGDTTDCRAERAAVIELDSKQVSVAQNNATTGLIMMSAFPFTFLIGLILFVGGKVEQTVRAEARNWKSVV